MRKDLRPHCQFRLFRPGSRRGDSNLKQAGMPNKTREEGIHTKSCHCYSWTLNKLKNRLAWKLPAPDSRSAGEAIRNICRLLVQGGEAVHTADQAVRSDACVCLHQQSQFFACARKRKKKSISIGTLSPQHYPNGDWWGGGGGILLPLRVVWGVGFWPSLFLEKISVRGWHKMRSTFVKLRCTALSSSFDAQHFRQVSMHSTFVKFRCTYTTHKAIRHYHSCVRSTCRPARNLCLASAAC